MMRHLTGTRSLALIAGLLFAGTGSALAQDTTDTGRATMDTTAPTGAIDTSGADSSAARDTTDTSVTNPPGYRGMERDTTMPADSGGAPVHPDTSSSAAAAGTGDTTGDSRGDSTTVGQTESPQPTSETPRIDPSASGGDSATSDSTQ
jgi:hypothetical protein